MHKVRLFLFCRVVLSTNLLEQERWLSEIYFSGSSISVAESNNQEATTSSSQIEISEDLRHFKDIMVPRQAMDKVLRKAMAPQWDMVHRIVTVCHKVMVRLQGICNKVSEAHLKAMVHPMVIFLLRDMGLLKVMVPLKVTDHHKAMAHMVLPIITKVHIKVTDLQKVMVLPTVMDLHLVTDHQIMGGGTITTAVEEKRKISDGDTTIGEEEEEEEGVEECDGKNDFIGGRSFGG